MGLVREPSGIDFVVDSRKLKEWEKEQISDIISHYKKTGEVKKETKPGLEERKLEEQEK